MRLGFGRVQGSEGPRVQGSDTGTPEPRNPGTLSIMQSRWPEPIPVDEGGTARVETMRELIVAVRNIRAEMEVPAKTEVRCIVNSADAAARRSSCGQSEGLVGELAGVSGLEFGAARPDEVVDRGAARVRGLRAARGRGRRREGTRTG